MPRLTKKTAAKGKKTAAKGKKTSAPKICASFPAEHMKAYNLVKMLRRNNRKKEITPELRHSASIIDKKYSERRTALAAAAASNTEGTVKRIREAVGNLFWPKPAPQKKQASKKRVLENKIPGTTLEEYECFREYNNNGASSQEPARKQLALKYKSIKRSYELAQKNPDRKKKRSKYESMTPAIAVPVPAPRPAKPVILVDANWRPTPAPRRRNLTFLIPLPF